MRNAQTQQLLTDASELAGVEQQMQRTEDGVAALNSQLAAQKKSLGGLITTEKATLASLTVPQQETVTTNSITPAARPRPPIPGRPGARRTRPSPSPTPSSASPTSGARPGRLASTAPGWARPPGPRPGSRSRATPTSSGPRCRTSPPRPSSRATCSTTTASVASPSTLATATSSTPRRPGWTWRRSRWTPAGTRRPSSAPPARRAPNPAPIATAAAASCAHETTPAGTGPVPPRPPTAGPRPPQPFSGGSARGVGNWASGADRHRRRGRRRRDGRPGKYPA